MNPDTKAFCVPTIFVTNAGNSLRQEKADKLSEWLNIPITEEQVCGGEQNRIFLLGFPFPLFDQYRLLKL